MNEERLDRHIYQYVEAELRNYKTYKKLIAEHEHLYTGAKSSLGKDPSGRFSQGQTGDVTANEAIKMIANEARISRMVDVCRCIDDVLDDSAVEDYRIVEMRYFKGWYTDYGIIQELRIPERTYYRHKRDLIRRFALRMRLI